MTKSYAAKRLFEHGPLTFREFSDITGWPVKSSYSAINKLMATGVIEFTYGTGCRTRIYRLA